MTQQTARIQRKRAKGWKMPPKTIVVDRSTGFGNPFPVVKGKSWQGGVEKAIWAIGTWSGPAMWFKDTKEEAVRLSVDAFRAWITHEQQATLLARVKKELRGKNLACWCPLDQPCHADVLLELANGSKP